MHRPAWRYFLLLLLLVAGIGAAFSTWSTAQRIAELAQREQETGERIDRLSTDVSAITWAQQTYVTSARDGKTDGVPALFDRVRSDLLELQPRLRSSEASAALKTLIDGSSALANIEIRAQEHMRLGQDLMAADLIFSEGHATSDTLETGLRSLRASESAAFATARTTSLESAGRIIAVVVATWAVGLILLTHLPRPRAPVDASLLSLTQPLVTPSSEARSEEPAGPDLVLAADLCTTIGKLNASDELPAVLERAASILDASGIVLWMAAGEELFAAAAFGYQPQIISRLGPINRSAINATAAAWRTGALQLVASAPGARGAIVAPMMGPDRCIGVLAVEIMHGRESGSTTAAVARMFAAQLAAALGGWPAASAAAPISVPPLDKAAEA